MRKFVDIYFYLAGWVTQCIGLAAVVFFLGTPAFPQDRGSGTFFSDSGDSLKVSVFQEIPGFWPSLRRLDENTKIIDLSGDWAPMDDADIWVFILKNRSDAVMLPRIVAGILRDYYDGSSAFSVEATLSVYGRSRKRLLHFSFVDDFGDNAVGEIGCTIATFLFFRLRGNGIQNIQDSLQYCRVN